MAREPILMASVGKKGVGKSYQTMQLMMKYVQGSFVNGVLVPPRRCLIMDINDEYMSIPSISLNDVPLFSMHPQVEIRRIRPLLPGGKRMGLEQWTKALFFVLQNYFNGFLLIEDLNRFIGDYTPDDLVGAICTNRHTGLDVCLHYQSIGRLTPKIWQNLNVLRFHKNNESVDRHQNKFPDKYEYLKIAEKMIEMEYYAKNIRFYIWVDLEYEKLKGNFSEDLFIRAVDEYISEHRNKLIKPYSFKLDKHGKKMFTDEEALIAERERFKKTYL